MSATQSSTASPSNTANALAATSLSESEFPSLPGAVPAVIEDINHLQAQILRARTAESAHKTGQELGERLRELTELFTKLFDSANEVSRLASPFFNKEKGAKGPWDSERAERQARKEAIQALRGLDQVMKEDVAKRVVHPEVTVTPNYLPSIQGLSGSLRDLSSSLHGLMTEALNPSKEADIENLKRQLAELRESFQDLGSQAKALEKPVAEKLRAHIK